MFKLDRMTLLYRSVIVICAVLVLLDLWSVFALNDIAWWIIIIADFVAATLNYKASKKSKNKS